MSSSTSQQPDRTNTPDRASSVAKLLDRARSINIRPDPEDAAVAQYAAPVTPVQRSVQMPIAEPVVAAPVEEARPMATLANESKREGRPRRKSDTSRTLSRSFDIVNGPSTRALTVRIPDETHARLVLIATCHRLGRTGEASTLNELIAEGIEHVLQRYDAA